MPLLNFSRYFGNGELLHLLRYFALLYSVLTIEMVIILIIFDEEVVVPRLSLECWCFDVR